MSTGPSPSSVSRRAEAGAARAVAPRRPSRMLAAVGAVWRAKKRDDFGFRRRDESCTTPSVSGFSKRLLLGSTEVRKARPTIYDVARLAGVSTATVSRALNATGQIAPATRAAIDAAVEQLAYQPNTAARSLVTRSSQTLALLLPDITNPFYAALVSGIQER